MKLCAKVKTLKRRGREGVSYFSATLYIVTSTVTFNFHNFDVFLSKRVSKSINRKWRVPIYVRKMLVHDLPVHINMVFCCDQSRIFQLKFLNN